MNDKYTQNTRLIRCPQCKKMARYDESNESRPFCSARCQLIDAGAWADEDYRVAGEPSDDFDGDF